MFDNKVVLVTGGSRGIGKATAKRFKLQGASVAILSKDERRLKKTAEEIHAFGVVADVRDSKQVSKAIQKILVHFGRIDILINNAGVAYSNNLIDTKEKEWDEIFDVNVKGIYLVTKVVLPLMVKNHSGVIINVSSGAGKSGIPGYYAYSASKFAVIGLTESLAGEVEKEGIKVFAICPGMVATDMIKKLTGVRIGMPPEKIAQSILQIASDNPPIKPGECLEIYR